MPRTRVHSPRGPPSSAGPSFCTFGEMSGVSSSAAGNPCTFLGEGLLIQDQSQHTVWNMVKANVPQLWLYHLLRANSVQAAWETSTCASWNHRVEEEGPSLQFQRSLSSWPISASVLAVSKRPAGSGKVLWGFPGGWLFKPMAFTPPVVFWDAVGKRCQ